MSAETKRVRTIHVGVGGRDGGRLRSWARTRSFSRSPWWTSIRSFRERAKAELGLPDSASFADLAPALEAVEADAVIICTPTRTHGPLARQAFAAGRHVLVEKRQ